MLVLCIDTNQPSPTLVTSLSAYELISNRARLYLSEWYVGNGRVIVQTVGRLMNILGLLGLDYDGLFTLVVGIRTDRWADSLSVDRGMIAVCIWTPSVCKTMCNGKFIS